MAIIQTGDFPIDPYTVDGVELAARLNRLQLAISSGQASATRPPFLAAGGNWAKATEDGFDLMIYDGVNDYTILTIRGTTVRIGSSVGNAPITFQDEGTALGTPGTVEIMNFVGPFLTAERTGNTLKVTANGKRPFARIQKSGTFALSTTPSKITGWSATFDNDTLFRTATNDWRVNTPGVYQFQWSCQLTDSPAVLITGAYLNGAVYSFGSAPGTTLPAPFQASTGGDQVFMATTDYLDLQGYYTNGTNVAIASGAACTMSMAYLGALT